MRRLIAVLLALVTTLGTVPVVASQASTEDAAPEPYETTVPSFDDHEVPIRVYEAAGEDPAPTLLWGHGWAGSYADSSGDGAFFAENGYNVVAMDFRGHGEAREDSQARVHSPDFEIRDVRHVIDWIAQQGFAQLEGGVETDRPGGDPVLGALGGSYGGGYQLLTAAFDDRLDAIAPEITWNDLPRSLAPNGAVKSTWVDALYGAGVAQANLAPFIHEGYAWSTAMNEFPDGELPGEPDVKAAFTASSPATYPGEIDVPALLIQGMPDLLFPLNEAIANAHQLQAAGSPEVKLVTHNGGHVLHTDGTLGGGPFDVGLQQAAGESPCGDTDELVLAWYDDHLKGEGDDGIAQAAIALDDGGCVSGPAVAAAALGEAPKLIQDVEDVTLPQGVPVASGYAQAEQEVRVSSPVQRDVLETEQAADVVGVPELSGSITVTGTQAIVYVSLVLNPGEEDRIVHDQVAALRVEGPVESESVSLDLTGVGVHLDAGDTLAVEFSTAHPVFGDNGNRQPGVVELTELELGLPIVTS